MKKLLLALPVVLLLAVGCSSNQPVVKNQPTNTQRTQNQQTTPSPTNTQTQQAITDLKTYSNTKYRFELNYPSGWVISENDDYISIKPTANSQSGLMISTVNVGRESVFDIAAKVKIQDINFAGKKAKTYNCQQSGNVCPNQLTASVAVHLTELPTGWGQGNEIGYDVYKSDNTNVQDFQNILNSFRFTK